MKKNVVKKSDNLSAWYTDVILNSRLADYSPVKGCMVMRPNGYGIWENIHKYLDLLLKDLGIENAYFPLFIPISFLQREAHHVEGFSPELAVVTHGGGEKLSEDLAIRPTSETIMYDMYHKWVSSYRDLPILLNQWNNVVRWEKRTYFFLRTTEFLWQEAHTVHSSRDEEIDMVHSALETYRKFVEEYLAIPVFKGVKSESEKFAGANFTTTIEAMMPDGKSLQSGTSHSLGQNFSKKDAFDISFSDENGQTSYAYQTSFGLSTRIIGALIMVHGDDNGLVLPPRIAPTQVILIPVEYSEDVSDLCKSISVKLSKAGVTVKILKDNAHTLGWRLNECELQGIPLYIAIGRKEVETGNLTIKVRHDMSSFSIGIDDAIEKVLEDKLTDIQNKMFSKALIQRDSLIRNADNYEVFKDIMATNKGYIKAFWCEGADCEKQIKEETKATTRCLPFTDNAGSIVSEKGICIRCGKNAIHKWLFAQAY